MTSVEKKTHLFPIPKFFFLASKRGLVVVASFLALPKGAEATFFPLDAAFGCNQTEKS